MDKRPVDWEEVARQLSASFAGESYPSTSIRLHERFRAMTPRQLSTALDEIAVANLSESARAMLEKTLGNLLMEKDPETGLTRFFPRLLTGDWRWLLSAHLTDWVVQDPDRATAWLTRQIAAGSLESKQIGTITDALPDMVSPSFFALLPTNSGAAGRMLSALPINLRISALGSMNLRNLKDSEQAAWAGIVRTSLFPNDHLKSITYPTGNWSDDDGSPMTLAETSAYLSRIDATPAEIAASVLSVVADPASWRSRDESRSLRRT